MLTLQGLTDAEAERLRAAGFPAALAETVRREAEQLRFLALKRPAVTVVAGGVAAAGSGVLIGLLEAWFGGAGWLAGVLLPIIIAFAAILPDWEVARLEPQDRRRWAAARLAVLAVQAEPDDAGAGQGNEAYQELERLARAAADLPSAQDALRRIADELDEAAREAAERARSGRADLAPDRTARLRWRDSNALGAVLFWIGLGLLALTLAARALTGG